MEYRSPSEKTGSWTEANIMCREEGGTLADLHANNMKAVSALPNHNEFWVGLYRNTSWEWHTGRLGSGMFSHTRPDFQGLYPYEENLISHTPYRPMGKIKIEQPQVRRQVMFLLCLSDAIKLCLISASSDNFGSLS